jgi:hypothetical protein
VQKKKADQNKRKIQSMCSPLSNKRWNGKPRGKRREKERYAKNHFHADLADIGGTHPLYMVNPYPSRSASQTHSAIQHRSS